MLRLLTLPAALGLALALLTAPAGAVPRTATDAVQTVSGTPATRTCAAPDRRATVVLLDTDTGVRNRAVAGGCTVGDLVDDERTWRSRGLFVAHVAVVSARLVRQGVLSRAEAARLVVAAARSDVGRVPGYTTILDGSRRSFERWAYAGDGGFDRNRDGSITSRAGEGGGFGTLWYPGRTYGDFSLRLKVRDDAPGDLRGNSGVQVRFPSLAAPLEGCPTTFDGNETGNLSWIAVNCGHEIQVNDSPETGANDPRKTGSVYGFADLTLAEARPSAKGEWYDLEVRVVGQHYTVLRDGVVINEYENLPGVPFPGRPNDPDSSSRGLIGHVGVQAHGSEPDVVSFRDIRVRPLG